MVIELYKNSPEYIYKEAKYIWYAQLFENVESQKERVLVQGSNGYGVDEDIDSIPEERKSTDRFFIDYIVDGKVALSVYKAVLTLNSESESPMVFDTFMNPTNIRFAFDDACVMGLEEKIVKDENNIPNVDATPSFHSVKMIFNELPSDETDWKVDLIGKNDSVVKTYSGVVKLVTPPWEES